MSWNYRILADKHGDELILQIHEVYYDANNRPDGYTANPVCVSAESIEGINSILDKMKECLKKPILSVKNFPKEYYD